MFTKRKLCSRFHINHSSDYAEDLTANHVVVCENYHMFVYVLLSGSIYRIHTCKMVFQLCISDMFSTKISVLIRKWEVYALQNLNAKCVTSSTLEISRFCDMCRYKTRWVFFSELGTILQAINVNKDVYWWGDPR